MLFLPSLTKDKLLAQFSPNFTLQDGEPSDAGFVKALAFLEHDSQKLALSELHYI